MPIILKSARELALMRQACGLVVQVLDRLACKAAPGVTTAELDALAVEMTRRAGAQPLFTGVPNPHGKAAFPAAICASRNNILVHGIPDDQPLLDGDILSIDFGVRLDGYCGDAAITLMIGNVSPQAKRLVQTTRDVLNLAVENCQPHRRWFEVAEIMDSFVKQAGFAIVQDFVGHGIGLDMHEDPRVPNFVDPNGGDFVLEPGLVIAIEPMVNVGSKKVKTLNDGWTVRTADSKLCAHFEHTVAITEDAPEVLTPVRDLSEVC